MTIATDNNRNSYTANGTNTTFAYTFKVFNANDLAVYIGSVVQSSYSVTGAGDDNGGNIIFTTAPASGEIVTIVRDEPFTQEIDYVEGDDFPADAHEQGLDRSVLRDLTLKEQIDRCVSLGVANTISPVLPDPDANKIIGWNAAGNQLENKVNNGSSQEVTALGGTTPITNGVRASYFLTPYDFGAVGDGVANDSAALRNLFASSSTMIYMAPGTYRVQMEPSETVGVIISDTPGRKIFGPGVITATTTVFVAFRNYAEYCNITLNIHGNNKIGFGVRSDAINCVIKECVIKYLFSDDFSATAISCNLSGYDGSVIITDNIIQSVEATTAQGGNGLARGVSLNADRNMTATCIVSGNVISDLKGTEGDSITVFSKSGSDYLDFPVLISDNAITGWTRRAVKVQANKVKTDNNNIRNIYDSAADVPNLQSTIDMVQGDGHTITNNRFDNCKFGNHFSINSTGETLNNNTIKNNEIYGIGAETTGNLAYIDMNGSNLDISGNTIHAPDFVGNAFVVAGANQVHFFGNNMNAVSGSTLLIESNNTDVINRNNTLNGAYYGNDRSSGVGATTFDNVAAPTLNTNDVYYSVVDGFCTAEFILDWSGLDITDTSPIEIRIPSAIRPPGISVNFAVNLRESTGFVMAAGDYGIYGGPNTGGDALIFSDKDKNLYTYDGGQIQASGSLIINATWRVGS